MRAELPIDSYLPEIVAALADGNLVLVAEPGAGKTTRAPAALLEAGWIDGGEIVVVEPRRIAARLAAHRVAAELGQSVGEKVGYEVRHDRKVGRDTRLRFITEGILMRRWREGQLDDPARVFVLDEVHERSLDTDLALSLLRDRQRNEQGELRILAMSATLEAEKMATFLDAPILRVPGRVHPVEIEHAKTLDDRPLEVRVRRALGPCLRDASGGDVLVFLPGAAEIRRAANACEEICQRQGVDLELLHGSLTPAEQDAAIQPGPRRKVVLSTNVAETSVTIEGVDTVIDSGLARIATFDPGSSMPSLQVRPISQASATQRAGRAGRLRPGRCIRLYTEHDHHGRALHDKPEILRLDLSEATLLLYGMGRDPSSFPFFEAPPPGALRAATELLHMLGAVEGGTITDRGRAMLRLPLHPRLARVAIEAQERGIGSHGALAVALLSEREIRTDLRERFGRGRGGDDEVGSSDVVDRLERFEAAEAEGLNARAARAHGLDPQALRSVDQTRRQVAAALRCARTTTGSSLDHETEQELLIAIASGYGDRVGAKRSTALAERRGASDPDAAAIVLAAGGSARLEPQSVVKQSPLLVALDLEERRGGAVLRQASAIEAEWLLELFPERITERNELRFNERSGVVEQCIALDYGAIVLDESVRRAESSPAATRVLLEAAKNAGLHNVLDLDAVEAYRRRYEFAREHGLQAPALDDAGLEQALVELAEGALSFQDLRQRSFVDLLRYRLPSEAQRRLDELAPEAVSIAGRKRAPIRYEPGQAPSLSSRIQDFFGMKEGPTVAAGRVPVVLHLLAPNNRAVQITTDLAGFWVRHYPTIRQELKRRYRRHAWPEDPTQPYERSR